MNSSSRPRKTLAALVLTFVLMGASFSAPPAKANKATQPLYAVCLTDWYCGSNYEFKSPSWTATNVDWMWDMMWWGNADVNKIRAYLLQYGHNNSGSVKTFFMYKGGPYNYEWPVDNGRKNDAPQTCTNEHVYTFGPNTLPTGGGLGNVGNGWGYVVFGSTHQDKDEGSIRFWCDEEYGWSETAENLTGNRFDANTGGGGWWTVYDYLGVGNAQYGWNTVTTPGDPGYEDKPHYWENDGSVTVVWTP